MKPQTVLVLQIAMAAFESAWLPARQLTSDTLSAFRP